LLLPPLDDVLIPFDLVRFVRIVVATLHAPARVFSQQLGATFRRIAVDRLARATAFARDDEIPGVRLADR
jgi:hypothetical protein